MLKKLCSILLALFLVVCTSPIAFAEEVEGEIPSTSTEIETVVEEETTEKKEEVNAAAPAQEQLQVQEKGAEKVEPVAEEPKAVEEKVTLKSAPAATEEEEVAYYTWHSEDEQGNTANPKFVNVNPNVTEENFETNQSTIVLEAYDKNGNNIKNKNQYVPIDKVERTIEGDIQHPGVNSVVETLTYNDMYSETIYHSLYTFITVNYIEKITNKVLHTWNYETIGWGFKFSEEDENISAITADMDETEKTNFYNQFYSPRQDTRYKTWNVSEWDKISIDGYDYVETIGAIAGTFADLTQQHNIFVYYQEHIDDPEPIIPDPGVPGPDPEPESTPTPDPKPEKPVTPVAPINPGGGGDGEDYEPDESTTITTAFFSGITADGEETDNIAKAKTINEIKIPLAKTEETWALVNLSCVVVTVVVSLILVILGWYNRWRRRNIELDEKYYNDYQFWLRNKIILRIVNLLIAIISIVVFILTENIFLKLVFIDRFTPLMIVLAILAIGVAFFSKYVVKEYYPYDDDENENGEE